MAVPECDLAHREQRRRPSRPQFLNEPAIAGIAGHVGTEVRDADPDGASRREHPGASPQERQAVDQREVLEHVLQHEDVCGAWREWQLAADIPYEVGMHPDQVEVDPTLEIVHARPELQPEPTGWGAMCFALRADNGVIAVVRFSLAHERTRKGATLRKPRSV